VDFDTLEVGGADLKDLALGKELLGELLYYLHKFKRS
jgi:hypothetical protein